MIYSIRFGNDVFVFGRWCPVLIENPPAPAMMRIGTRISKK
jgi:hypothetical protein